MGRACFADLDSQIALRDAHGRQQGCDQQAKSVMETAQCCQGTCSQSTNAVVSLVNTFETIIRVSEAIFPVLVGVIFLYFCSKFSVILAKLYSG